MLLREHVNRAAQIVVGGSFTLLPGLQRMLRALEPVTVSLVASVFLVLLALPGQEAHLQKFSKTTEVLVGIASLIGTILGLILTLSIIPIQRATEAMPLLVIRLYLNPRTIVSV